MASIYRRFNFSMRNLLLVTSTRVLSTNSGGIDPLCQSQQDATFPNFNSRFRSAYSCMPAHFESKNNIYFLSHKKTVLKVRSPIAMRKMPLANNYHTCTSEQPINNLHDVARPPIRAQYSTLYNLLSHGSNNISRLRQNKICFSSIHTIANNVKFRTMEGIQSLATNPTREHIENIRSQFALMNAKCNDNQQITLVKDSTTGIGTVCIKSGCKNGISAKMMSDLLDVIDELYLWKEGKGVLIYGHGGFFCSGGDLVSVRELANYENGLNMATLMQYNLSRLQALPMITMAMIQGKAIGGGAEIAVATDLRIITKTAKIGYVHARVGICSAWGGGSRLVQLVGPGKALEMMASGRLVSAQEAYQMGLVNYIIDCDETDEAAIMAKAHEYLKAHLIGAKTTIIAMKGIVNAARTLPLEQALVAECQLLASTWGKEAHLAALNNNIKHNDA